MVPTGRSRIVFVRQTTELTLYVPLLGTEVNRFRVRVPGATRNFFVHLQKRTKLKGNFIFFGFVRLFLKKFQMAL